MAQHQIELLCEAKNSGPQSKLFRISYFFEVCSLADVNGTIIQWAWLILGADIYAKCFYALIHGNYAWQLSPEKSLLSCHPVSSLDNIHP